MVIWIVILGLFTLFFGLLFMFSPNTLMKMNEGLNKMVQGVDTQAMRNRMVVGVVLIVLSLFFFYHATKLGVR
jgi:hypothetical protein